MDPDLFSESFPGTLTQHTINNRADYAFIPNPLPNEWHVEKNLWPLIAEAKEKIGILEGIGRNLPNPDILISPLAKTEAIKSSSIEGTYATPMEYLMYELNPKEGGGDTEKKNDWRQVINYSSSLRYSLEEVSRRENITLPLFRDMHKLLLRGVRGKERHPGRWRPDFVMIGYPSRFVPPPVTHLDQCLEDLVTYINTDNAIDYLIKSFLVHYQFETIHPFSDGNGRMGRLLLTLTLSMWSPMTKPWLFLSSFFEKHRNEYIDRLFNVSTKNEWTEWIRFCLEGTIITATETIEKVENLRKLQQDLHDKVRNTGGSVRLSTLVDQLFISPFIDTPQAVKMTGMSFPTMRKDLHKLIDCGILKPLKGEKPVIYYAPEVFDCSYSQD